ncbi:MAG: GerMN domain-containing protein [Oscillibacter sp.]|nr:GerMN domain-containing protein [Oscillibacter sp.]
MKRWIVCILCIVLSVAIGYTFVGPGENREGTEYEVFFRERDLSDTHSGDALRPELVKLSDESGSQERMEQLLERLLQGPEDETLSSVIPAGTTLLSVRHNGVLATVDLSNQYSALSGVELTLADYAITQTLTQLPEVMLVKVTVRGKEIPYRSGRILSQRDILFSPKEDVVSNVEAMLYFLDEEGTFIPTMETLNLYEGDTQVSAVVRALENGPQSKELLPVIPPDFRVRAVWQVENECYVNFSSKQLESLENESDYDTMCQGLEKSLSSLETVEKVNFLIDGQFA